MTDNGEVLISWTDHDNNNFIDHFITKKASKD